MTNEEKKQNHRRDSAKWYAENAARCKAVRALRYLNNPDKARVDRNRWRKANPAKIKVITNIRRMRKLQSVGGVFAAEQWLALVSAYDNKCVCCLHQKPLEADHVIPLSKGGSSDIGNIQPLCKSCNCRKGTESTDYRLDYEQRASYEGVEVKAVGALC